MVAQQSNHFPIRHCFQRVDLFDTAVSVVVSQDDLGGELAEGWAGEPSFTEPRGMRRLLKGAGYGGKTSLHRSRFGVHGGRGVEAPFESCRLPRIAFSLLRSRFLGPARR